MRLFDTHCHFERADASEIAAVLVRAKVVGVEKLMAVGGSPALNESAVLAASEELRVEREELPQVACALGYDREQIKHRGTGTEWIGPTPCPCASVLKNKQAAVGEIGLDYHYSPETREAQLKLFAAQLGEARARNLPVVIHTREAADDTIALLKEIPSRGIIHCFTGDPDEAKAYLDLGFFISFSGIVTFRAADNVRASVRVVPDDRILIETDSPFLAPVPMRGNPNEPAFIRYTCEFLAKFRNMPVEEFAELTFTNAERVLG